MSPVPEQTCRRSHSGGGKHAAQSLLEAGGGSDEVHALTCAKPPLYRQTTGRGSAFSECRLVGPILTWARRGSRGSEEQSIKAFRCGVRASLYTSRVLCRVSQFVCVRVLVCILAIMKSSIQEDKLEHGRNSGLQLQPQGVFVTPLRISAGCEDLMHTKISHDACRDGRRG